MKISISIILILFLTILSSLICRVHSDKTHEELDFHDRLTCDDRLCNHEASQQVPANSQKNLVVKKICIGEQVSTIKEWLMKIVNCMVVSSQTSEVSSTTVHSTSTATPTTVISTTVTTEEKMAIRRGDVNVYDDYYYEN